MFLWTPARKVVLPAWCKWNPDCKKLKSGWKSHTYCVHQAFHPRLSGTEHHLLPPQRTHYSLLRWPMSLSTSPTFTTGPCPAAVGKYKTDFTLCLVLCVIFFRSGIFYLAVFFLFLHLVFSCFIFFPWERESWGREHEVGWVGRWGRIWDDLGKGK